MKAGIITLLSDNYGAVLQAYALAKAVENNGVQPEIIHYNDKNRITYGMSTKRKVLHLGRKGITYLLTGNGKHNKLERFRRTHLPLSSHRYTTHTELAANPPSYDVYMAGSDQIWNPDLFVFDYSYFLPFAPEGAKKISYASSFGKASFAGKYATKCGKMLREFRHVSVRETSGVPIVKMLCGKDATVCLDPTFLLTKEQWMPLIENYQGKYKDKRYIVMYVMPGDTAVTDAMEQTAQILSARTGCPIIRLGQHELELLKRSRKECDPACGLEAFLYLFANAEHVVTNSFHGTAVSLIFEKRVYVPINSKLEGNKTLHERIKSLVGLLDIPEIFLPCDGISEDTVPTVWPYEDRAYAARLQQEREKSLTYLRKSLEDCR